MTVKKAIELIEQNSRHHLEGIELYNEVLKKYEESGKAGPQPSELTKMMREIFLGLMTMIKNTKETQIQFNSGIVKLLTEKKELVVQDKVSGRRNQVRKLLLEGYKQKEIAQKIGTSLSTVEKDIREIRKRKERGSKRQNRHKITKNDSNTGITSTRKNTDQESL